MISVERAQLDIAEQIAKLTRVTESVPLMDAYDRVCAETIFAEYDLPPFKSSSMDGYAVIAADTESAAPKTILDLDIIGEQPAGADLGLALRPATCVRIFTGAPLPAGADAVVMQEDVKTLAGAIFLEEPVVPGSFVRHAGEDVASGQKIIDSSLKLNERHLTLLAAQGRRIIAVYKRPRVAIITTGSELRAAGLPLRLGEIYETNGLMLALLVKKAGGLPINLPHVKDELPPLLAAIDAALKCDVVVIVGGMSVGEHDLVKIALTRKKVQQKFWRVKVKPGKPFLFSLKNNIPIFGLPGNPVSAFVTFHLFVKPALELIQNVTFEERMTSLTASEKLINEDERVHYVRGTISKGFVRPSGRQGSHILSSLATSDCLIRVPGNTTIQPGSKILCQLL
ncbi:MAG: molybdopterin molybdotransferase MoeA [Verrucomicrobiota bacterium]|nr:molybdopterin molybdotransferase MoeA [Verrucomicrobiota bacterium]